MVSQYIELRGHICAVCSMCPPGAYWALPDGWAGPLGEKRSLVRFREVAGLKISFSDFLNITTFDLNTAVTAFPI